MYNININIYGREDANKIKAYGLELWYMFFKDELRLYNIKMFPLFSWDMFIKMGIYKAGVS
jgi:hypothetical protein